MAEEEMEFELETDDVSMSEDWGWNLNEILEEAFPIPVLEEQQ